MTPNNLEKMENSIKKEEPDYKLKDKDLLPIMDSFQKGGSHFNGGLNLAGHDLTDYFVIHLSGFLKADFVKITTLDLSNNSYIGEKGFIELGSMLKTNTSLTKINLSNLTGGSMGDARITEGLRENKNVQEAYVGNIGDCGIAFWGENFKWMNPLKHLEFTENKRSTWKKESKDKFIEGFRKEIGKHCTILSVNVHSDTLDTHSCFIGSLSLICEMKRKYFIGNYESESLMKL